MDIILPLIFLLILIPLCIGAVSMAPWVPTRAKDIERLLDILELQKGDTFLEIGCGDGRVSQAVAKKFPQVRVEGVEIAFPMYILASIRRVFGKQGNFHLQLANAFKKDFSHYDAIYVYGMPDKMSKKIVPKFLSEAKKGAKLYSYVFSISDDLEKQIISHGEPDEAKIHILEKK